MDWEAEKLSAQIDNDQIMNSNLQPAAVQQSTQETMS